MEQMINFEQENMDYEYIRQSELLNELLTIYGGQDN